MEKGEKSTDRTKRLSGTFSKSKIFSPRKLKRDTSAKSLKEKSITPRSPIKLARAKSDKTLISKDKIHLPPSFEDNGEVECENMLESLEHSMSKPSKTVKMSDEDKIRYIQALNFTVRPVRTLPESSNGPVVKYHRIPLSSNEGKTIGDIKIAKNSWIARDEAELNVSIGDELTISISDSSWAYGSKANSSDNDLSQGWFPLHVFLPPGTISSRRLQVRSVESQQEDEDDSSIILNKKRFTLRLEEFIQNRPEEDLLVRDNIIDRNITELTEMYANIPKPPPLPPLSPRKEASRIFNNSPKKGIIYIEKEVVKSSSADEIAKFLLNSSLIDKHVLGDYLGDPGEWNSKIRDSLFKNLDFSLVEYDMALRRFLDVFRLPGEAQKIDRLMQSFAKNFYKQQSGKLFKSEDAAYILAFSTVMLNTDLHNPSVKYKMTKEQFVNQNRGVNEGENFPKEFLEHLYDTIEEDEIVDNNILPGAFKRGWLGMQFTKNSSPVKYKSSWVLLDRNGVYCFKAQEGFRATCTIPLRIITSVKKKKKNLEFIVKTSSGNYVFTARSAWALESWTRTIKILLKK